MRNGPRKTRQSSQAKTVAKVRRGLGKGDLEEVRAFMWDEVWVVENVT
jgi:hypothetical protein